MNRHITSIKWPFLLVIGLFYSCATSEIGAADRSKIKNKTYVILGASSGFGRGVAEKIGANGANVVLASRRTDVLEQIAKKIDSSGGRALVVTTDISKPDEVKKLGDVAKTKFGRVDVWINMAGVGAIGSFWNIPLEDQARLIDVNLKGFVYGSYTAVNLFKSQGYGTLINMGSIESVNPLAYHATYAATKAGILNLSKTIGQELRLDGQKQIKVVTIEPWAVDTPFWRHAANYSGGTPRMAAMDPPSKVVNAVIRTSLRPRKEIAVGWKAKAAKFSHNLFPHLTETVSANVAHRSQIKNAPAAPNTTGSLYKPILTGTGVDDGVRARMRKEKLKMKEEKNSKIKK